LQELDWYQNLIVEDEERYLRNKELLMLRAAISGSTVDDTTALTRDSSNAVLLFEDPYQNQILEDPSTKIIHNTQVKRLKTKEGDTMVYQIISRTFSEL